MASVNSSQNSTALYGNENFVGNSYDQLIHATSHGGSSEHQVESSPTQGDTKVISQENHKKS